MPTDHELLHRFAAGETTLFATLVERHIDLVYTAARRQVQSTHLAEEVAHTVFIDLARQAGRIPPAMPLTAWLHTVTRRAAIDAIRGEARRTIRETTAAELAAMKTDPAFARLEPLLDEALAALPEQERTTLFLRFFENKNLRDIGAHLGVSEDAAQKRVARAVERLRAYFSQQGVTVSAAALGTGLATQAVQAAPAGLGAAIASTAPVTATTLLATAKTLAMTTAQKTLLCLVLAGALGCAVFEAVALRQQRRETARLTETVARLGRERDTATSDLAAARQQIQQNEALLAQADTIVSSLSPSGVASADRKLETEIKDWIGRLHQLKDWTQRMPDKLIPEMRFLTERDWLSIAQNSVENETAARQALNTLRQLAKNRFAPLLVDALKRYRSAHGDQAPTEMAQLAPFFDPPVDEAILQRYEVPSASTATPFRKPRIFAEKSQVDDEYDTRFSIDRDGNFGYERMSRSADLINQATKDYMNANNGKRPPIPWSSCRS